MAIEFVIIHLLHLPARAKERRFCVGVTFEIGLLYVRKP